MAVLLAATAGPRVARAQQAQDPEGDVLDRILAEDKQAEAARKDRTRPPIELSRSQVLPNDILPYIKANHWAMVGLEMRANHSDYEGLLQSRPVGLLDQPNAVTYRRDARLVKGQQARLTLPILLPAIPKEMGFQLLRPEAVRQDEDWPAALRVLEPHQHLIVVLAGAANDSYSRWNALRATIPLEIHKDDPALLDKYRYYRMVLPLDPERPILSPHPLTWTPISHVIWDGMPPERLGVGQQQALLDWLHWGGQLVIVGGAGPAFGPLRESFLAPYLPAEASGATFARTGEQLAGLARAYPPAVSAADAEGDINPLAASWVEVWNRLGRRYKPPAPITTRPDRPILFAELKPKGGAAVVPLGGEGDPPLAVEWRVGRGRVTMLAPSLADPDLSRWEGYDTLVRRVALRRPEEALTSPIASKEGGGVAPAHFETLTGRALSEVRLLGRDLGGPTRQTAAGEKTIGYTVNGFHVGNEEQVPVNEWLDSAVLPTMARGMLERASGIEIPSPRFVLKVILAYLIALVPINWLVCRYVIGRREGAWLVVPLLAVGFAVGVERAAAYDVGYDSSSDEVDVVETFGDYPRAHVSRFASIYSTGRVRYEIAYPKDPSALALPLATGRSLRGEDVVQSTLRTMPTPVLGDFLVQPRSLSLFRAEGMPNLPGTVALRAAAEGEGGGEVIANNFGVDLADAWLVEAGKGYTDASGSHFRGRHLGAIAAGAAVPVGDLGDFEPPDAEGKPNAIDPAPFERVLIEAVDAAGPGERGTLRLVGRVDRAMPGQEIDPPVDRHRGFTILVAHLREPALPRPDAPRYNTAVPGGEPVPPDVRGQPPQPANATRKANR